MLRLAARLPDALIGLRQTAVAHSACAWIEGPQPPGQPLAAAGVQQHRVKRRAEHVVLALVERAVPDSHRAGAVVA